MKILQLNLNHCEDAHNLLTQTARELKIDVVHISEPYKKLNIGTWISDKYNQAAIWVCSMQSIQNLAYQPTVGFARAKVGGIHLYSCYAPPSLSIEDFAILVDNLTDDAKNYSPVAIGGDFNAWAWHEWGSKSTNPRGQILIEAMTSLDVVLMNRGDKATFVRGEASSIIDITFVSSQLAKGKNHWKVTEIYTASDHQAIYWEIGATIKDRLNTKTHGWKISHFDSEAFKVALIDQPLLGNDPNEKADVINRRITVACDETMPRKRSSYLLPPVYWWNETISSIRKQCIRTRRLAQCARKKPHYQKMRASYKETRRLLNRAIKESKRRSWDELLMELETDPWGKPYKIVMSQLKRQPSPSPKCPKLLSDIVTTLFPKQKMYRLSIPTRKEEIQLYRQ
ncbi:uncharacterized protein LOC126979411 [Leptidea sinapis]|uniref:uncharacterized protein LOC126979411 n=1 Tax=Leptidea sinapis TaxID=189913 RepID=UPI0021C380F4|nr:uncharacterized protein LOC126979411 [Leptidea sinapis]